MKNNTTTYLICPGHSGLIGSEYLTAGKRSPVVRKGLGVYEGAFNRDVCSRVLGKLQWGGYHALNICPGSTPVTLAGRKRRIREAMRTFGKCELVAIHANAAQVPRGMKWSRAHGAVIFTSTNTRNQAHHKESVYLANRIFIAAEKRGIEFRKTAFKRANFSILSCKLPSVLPELAFMTNEADARQLASNDFREAWTGAIFEGLVG